MTTVKLPRDFDREAVLAARRHDALCWMLDKGIAAAIRMQGVDGLRDAARRADAECDELGRIADGQ